MQRLQLLLVLLLSGAVGCTTTEPESATKPDAVEEASEDANKAIVSGVSGNEVWLGQLNRGEPWSIDNLRNITTRQGYDNQPSFVASGSGVFYTSIRDGAQADIYLYEHSFNAGFRYTSTPQSEFSPQVVPVGDGISVVRVESDGKQGLWSYAGNSPVRLFPDLDNVGYYTWLDTESVAMFLVTEPATLVLGNVTDGTITKIDTQPGRSLAPIPGSAALSFVDKSDPDSWWISSYDRTSGKINQIAPTLEDSEDFAWTPDGELLMAQGKKIFAWREQWDMVLDLDGTVAGDITRINIGPGGKQIVFVAAEGPR